MNICNMWRQLWLVKGGYSYLSWLKSCRKIGVDVFPSSMDINKKACCHVINIDIYFLARGEQTWGQNCHAEGQELKERDVPRALTFASEYRPYLWISVFSRKYIFFIMCYFCSLYLIVEMRCIKGDRKVILQ